jgi:O-antigen/teichoic acid export membrane protein
MLLYSWKGTQKIGNNKTVINWVDFYKIGFTMSASSLIFFCFLRIDNFFVQRYCDSKTLSNYVQCGKVGQYFLYFSSIISTTMLPYISSEKFNLSIFNFKKMMLPYVVFLIISGIILILFGPVLYPFLFGEEYYQMYKYMYVFMPGYLSLSFLTILNALYIGNNNYVRIIIGDSIGLLAILLFDFIYVPKYGAVAAALISSIIYCIVFVYLLMGARDNIKK